MYYNKKIDDVLSELNTSIIGLTNEEALNRLKSNGKNKLFVKKKDNIIKIFFKEFLSPIEILLLITVIVSFIIGEKLDAFVILFIVLIDVIIGTYHENKALKTALSLSKIIKSKTQVIRDNNEIEIDSENLVVGDIIVVSSGSRVTCDARIIQSNNLQTSEASLTGESISVAKNNLIVGKNTIISNQTNMLFAGTNIMTGRGKAVVVGVGNNTEIGKISKTVDETEEEKSPLTIRIEKFSKQISIILLIIAIISAIVLYMKGEKVNTIFLSVIALTVSAMPEGLPLALTMALSIASNKMSKKNVIVKKLNAVESLGSCTVIASDKTGTLTVNEQTAKKIILATGEKFDITGSGYNANGEILPLNNSKIDEALNIIYLCNANNEAYFNEDYCHGDSIDIAFKVLYKKTNLNRKIKVEKQINYESEKQYSAIYYKVDNKLHCTIKGSLEKVMEFSEFSENYINQNLELSKKGYRVIAVCDGIVKDTSEKNMKKLKFLGMVGFIDPIRDTAKNSIKECNKAGIKVIMITGDHPLTAFTIGEELGLIKNESEVISGKEIEDAYNQGEKYFDNTIRNKKIFSRVTPIDKLHIVNAFKRMGEYIAVTGDGVNDAPALKTANIGIAMGSGTDVAKDNADMIVIDDDFNSIVSGIKEGRIAYSNIKKIVLFLLSCGFSEVMFYLLSVVLGYPLPLIAIQLLWINIVTDGLQDIALSFEIGNDEVMMEKPRKPTESLFNSDLMIEVVIYGLTSTFLIFFLWKLLIDSNTNIIYARSVIMMLMVFIQNIHVLNCKSEKLSIFKINHLKNPIVYITIIGSILLQIIIMNIDFLAKSLSITSININTLIVLFLYSSIIILIGEFYKKVYIIKKEVKK